MGDFTDQYLIETISFPLPIYLCLSLSSFQDHQLYHYSIIIYISVPTIQSLSLSPRRCYRQDGLSSLSFSTRPTVQETKYTERVFIIIIIATLPIYRSS